LLLQLLFDGLLIKPYLLVIRCFGSGGGLTAQYLVFEISIHLNLDGIFIFGSGKLTCRLLITLRGGHSDCAHTLYDLLIFVGVNGNFWIYQVGSLSLHIFAATTTITGLALA
jgi:hypothetical protein